MSETKKIILSVAVTSLLLLVLVQATLYAVDKSEVVECLKLQSYSQEYPQFYLTESENAMCLQNAIVIHAPVK